MAVLLGNDGAVQTASELSLAPGTFEFFEDGYTATGGTMTTAYIELGNTQFSTGLKIGVFASDGTLVAVSDEITPVWSSTVSGNISGTLTNGNTYYIGAISNSGGRLTIARVGTTYYKTQGDVNDYTTPTDITIPGSNEDNLEPRIWIEGTTTSAVSGDADITLDDFTVAGSATYESPAGVTGDASITLDALTVAGAGEIEVKVYADVLRDADGNIQANLTGINYSVFDQAPGAIGSNVPVVEVTGATTDGSGNIIFDCRYCSGSTAYIFASDGSSPIKIAGYEVTISLGTPP